MGNIFQASGEFCSILIENSYKIVLKGQKHRSRLCRGAYNFPQTSFYWQGLAAEDPHHPLGPSSLEIRLFAVAYRDESSKPNQCIKLPSMMLS